MEWKVRLVGRALFPVIWRSGAVPTIIELAPTAIVAHPTLPSSLPCSYMVVLTLGALNGKSWPNVTSRPNWPPSNGVPVCNGQHLRKSKTYWSNHEDLPLKNVGLTGLHIDVVKGVAHELVQFLGISVQDFGCGGVHALPSEHA